MYEELKKAAEAAPGGSWIAENDSLYFKDDGYTRHLLDADAGHDVEDEAYYAALKFIAAANPSSVLALIADRDSAHKHWENESNNVQVMLAELIKLKAENERLKANSEVLRLFVGCACPVSTEIDQRGHRWSEAYLDQALESVRDLMSKDLNE